MHLKLGQKIIDKIRGKHKKEIEYTEIEYNNVLNFFKYYQGFRNSYTCSKIICIEESKCNFLKDLCYKNRDLGMYYFEADADPQKYMADYIKNNTSIDNLSTILEIGPGNHPIFDFQEYVNWYGTDINYLDTNQIDFNGRLWANNKYPTDKMFNYGWENLSEIKKQYNDKFDFIVSSHSYEHVFEPIKSLIEASKILKDDGSIVLFVPDGFSDEPAARGEMTHTLYLVPKMIEEFFMYAGAFYDLKIETFRPNYDYVIVAKKRGNNVK
ncbi:MAG: methyltransferase domain-containing protein [Candidatus Gastranaerophilaceae bacterium]